MLDSPDILPEQPEAIEETADTAALDAECLVAMTGIFPTRPPTEIELVGARNYLARIRRRLSAFLEAKKAEPIKWSRPPSQKKLKEDIFKPFDQDDIAEWTAGLSVGAALYYPIVLQSAHDYLKAKWPKFEDTSMGLHDYDLSPDEFGDIWHLARMLNDFETVFDDLDSLVLLPEQVEAIAKCFPSLLAKTNEILGSLLLPYIEIQGGVKKQKHLLAEREEQIRVLLQIPQDAPVEIQQQKEPAKPARAPEYGRDDDGSAQTPSENVARVRTAKG